jgi:hypothetical protein
MKDGNTTLSVPKDFAETLRMHYNGHNDMQRLENWAENQEDNSNNNSITLTEIESAVESALKTVLQIKS